MPVAVVTGAASGIGRAIARRLAADGARIAALDIAENILKDAAPDFGADSLPLRCDVARESDILAALDVVRRTLGPIEILVNAAGVGCSPGLPFTNNQEADWDRVLSINVKGMFFTAKAAAPDMVAAKDGRIVNISSIVGIINAPFMPPYSVSKAAVNSMTKVLAKDLAPHGITVNAVCPGFVWTPMWDAVGANMVDRQGGGQGQTPREIFEDRVRTLVPMRREQTVEDVASLVAFLCSSEARNITGQVIAVDGGVTA